MQRNAEKASGGVRKVELVKRHYDAKESPVIYQMRTHKYEQKKRSGIRASSEYPQASQAQIQYSKTSHNVNTKEAKINLKKTRRKTAGRPDFHRAY